MIHALLFSDYQAYFLRLSLLRVFGLDLTQYQFNCAVGKENLGFSLIFKSSGVKSVVWK